MKLLLTGACGFVGSALAEAIAAAGIGWQITGFDNLGRPGSELNRRRLTHLGVKLVHGDLRCQSDVDALSAVDWVIDCAANPSVLAGADGLTSSRQLMEHNLLGTIQILEKCKRDKSGFILLSTSRVYSIAPLAALKVELSASPDGSQRFSVSGHSPSALCHLPPGVSALGVSEGFSTAPPISLYGASKLASETLALEYGATFGFPVWINRCGVLAGAGQFGKPDQGIFAFWLNAWLRNRPLEYIGFGGTGAQVRDCLHPRDLVPLLRRQMDKTASADVPRLLNFSGGLANSISLAQLSSWCEQRWGKREVKANTTPRPFDIPWLILDSTAAAKHWNWRPTTPLAAILEEIATHAEANPGWLELSGT